MPTIARTAVIRAAPEAVFDLIARVEDFARYSRAIRAVHAVGPNRYRWVVRAAGLELEWEASVTESERPRRFAWRSLRGLENGGCFDLHPAPGGTEVRFTMSYRLANPLLERLIEPLTAPIMQRVAGEMLDEVRRRLEAAVAPIQ
jgi:uncharacterized membrane protein